MVAVQAYGVGDVMADGEVRSSGAEPSVVVREVNNSSAPAYINLLGNYPHSHFMSAAGSEFRRRPLSA